MKKIVIIGPESTGKSSLCRQLAEHYSSTWCPEYARAYLEALDRPYTYEDLLQIAKGQLELEDDMVRKTITSPCFIDTNMYVMQVWCEYVYGKCHQFILDELVSRQYDLYLLCNVDLPWSYDALREYPDEAPRKELYRYYRELMIEQTSPWVEISGLGVDRFDAAVAAIDRIT
ncbi:MAG TPA: AAA family ATPase [Chitinophagaceae bacterium]